MSVNSEESEANDSASTRNNNNNNNNKRGISLFDYFASQVQSYIVEFRARSVMDRIELSTIPREALVSSPGDFTAMARAARSFSLRK